MRSAPPFGASENSVRDDRRVADGPTAGRREDLVEGRVAVQRVRAAVETVVEDRRVDLGLTAVPVELHVRDAAAEEVPTVRGRRIGHVLRENQLGRERCTSVRRLVEPDLRDARRREAAAVHRRRPVPGDRRADEDVVRVGRIDRDRADRAPGRDRAGEVGGDVRTGRVGRRAPRDQRPRRAAVGRLVETDAGLGIARAVRLARADVDRHSGRVVRVIGDRADRIRRDTRARRRPLHLLVQRVRRTEDTTAGRADQRRTVLRRAARRRHRERRHAAREDRPSVPRGRLAGDGRRRGHTARTDQLPAGHGLLRVQRLDRERRCPSRLCLRRGDRGAGYAWLE